MTIRFRVTNRAGKVFSRHHLEALARKRRQALALEHPRITFRVEARTARGWRHAGPDPKRRRTWRWLRSNRVGGCHVHRCRNYREHCERCGIRL